MPNLQATEAAVVIEQKERVLTAILKAWHDGEVLSVAELKKRLQLSNPVYNTCLLELAADGLIEQA